MQTSRCASLASRWMPGTTPKRPTFPTRTRWTLVASSTWTCPCIRRYGRSTRPTWSSLVIERYTSHGTAAWAWKVYLACPYQALSIMRIRTPSAKGIIQRFWRVKILRLCRVADGAGENTEGRRFTTSPIPWSRRPCISLLGGQQRFRWSKRKRSTTSQGSCPRRWSALSTSGSEWTCLGEPIRRSTSTIRR